MRNDFKAVRNALLITALTKTGQRVSDEFKARRTWTVTVGADDDLYYDVAEWLMTQENIRSPRRSLAVATRYVCEGPNDERRAKLQVAFDGNATNRISIDGHEVAVRINDADNPTVSDKDIQKVIKPPRLIFTARTRAGRDAMLAVIRNIHDEKHSRTRRPALNMLGRWNDWVRRGDIPQRSMESVVVKGNVVDDLLADLTEFRRREKEYNYRGIPYHRAYLLSGPPGTGKTSAVKAVAGALGMDLWYAPLSDLGKDGKLVDTLSSVNPGSILLLEDIDSFKPAVSRETGKDELSNSGLLNALDGVATPHGLVTIMTTNHPEKLDHALIRPGRIDRIFTFENPDSETIHRHFEFFYGAPANWADEWPEGMSSAAVSEIFKRHMDDPAAAELELLAFSN